MKKNKLIMLFIFVMFIIFFANSVCFGANFPSAASAYSKFEGLAANAWTTFATVAKMLAIAAIVFAGVRYMFASSDKKADIKNQLIYIALGSVLVFSAVTFAQYIQNLGKAVL